MAVLRSCLRLGWPAVAVILGPMNTCWTVVCRDGCAAVAPTLSCAAGIAAEFAVAVGGWR